MTFGFEVEIAEVPPGGDLDASEWARGYRVQLPHQCQEWTIVQHDDPVVAVRRMEQFVAEATLALARLKELSAPLPG